MATCTLALDGSTYAGSVALLRDSVIVAERTLADTGMPPKGGREERMLPLVVECLEESGVRAGELGRVVCGAGPGSFTSLRIAASVAKGLAAGLGCPFFSVSSLLLTVAGLELLPPSGLHLSVLPAMRDEWFVAKISVDAADMIEQVSPVSIMTALHLREAEEAGASIVGPGQADDARPHARGVARLLAAIVARGAENLDGWEPDYGRLAEAQVKWEAAHGRSLFAG